VEERFSFEEALKQMDVIINGAIDADINGAV
jgi:hypothetical protein